MSELLSSSEFSDILEDDSFVVTPQCPVCRRNYNERVEPLIIQPCGHGICKKCLLQLHDHARNTVNDEGEYMVAKCPICRGEIIDSSPNYDLKQITNNVKIAKTSYWEKQILELNCISGRRITFTNELKPFVKCICVRLAYDEHFLNIKMPLVDCTREELSAVLSMKNALVRAALTSNESMEVICKWIGILAFTKDIEGYFVKFFMQWFDYKDYLDGIDGAWILDVLTHPVV